MKEQKKQAFTLIELLIVASIMIIMSLVVYTPYQHYQTKQKVTNSIKTVSQTLYDARSLAINGIETASGNLSIGAYFSSGASDIIVYKYPISENIIDYRKSEYELKKISLEPGVQLNLLGGKDNALFLYNAISGSGRYFYYTSGTPNDFSSDEISINLGFGGTQSGTLSKKINYYTKTYVADIE